MGPKTQLKRKAGPHTKARKGREQTFARYSAIDKLPAELLVEVFLFYASWLSPSEYPYYRRTWDDRGSHDRHKVFIIAGVCRRWREIALTSPRLWCRFAAREDSSPSFVARILSLSQSQPLDVVLKPGEYGKRQSYGIFATIISNMRRIRTLELRGVKCQEKHLQRIPPVCAPALRKLALEFSLPEGRTIAELEACEMPSLEDLTIKEYTFCWDSTLLRPTLTHLTLTHYGIRSPLAQPQTFSLSKILDVLAMLPLLQNLDLQNTLRCTYQGIPLDRMVHLSHLREIFIRDDTPKTAQFLHHIIFPTSTSMKFICGTDGGTHGLEDLFTAVANKWNGKSAIGPPASYQCASLRPLSEYGQHKLACSRLPKTTLQSSADFSLTFGTSWESSLERGPGVIAAIMRALSTLKLIYLHLESAADGPNDADTWFTYCAPMTHLRTLRVDGHWADEALALALERHLPEAGTRPPSSHLNHDPLFPQLRRLHLVSTARPSRDSERRDSRFNYYSSDEYEDEDRSEDKYDDRFGWKYEDKDRYEYEYEDDDEEIECDLPLDSYLAAVIARSSSGTLEKVDITAPHAYRPSDEIEDLSEYVSVSWNDTDSTDEENEGLDDDV